jgi:DNA-binding NtrC family response regulator
MSYSWPGNVRELESVIERTLLLADGDVIHQEDLPATVRMRGGSGAGGFPADIPDEGVNLDQLERRLILRALEKAAGNVTRAARLLGLSRRTLQYRLEKIQGTPDGAASAPDGAADDPE